MLAAERILLYSVSFALGALMIREIGRPASVQAVPAVRGKSAPDGSGEMQGTPWTLKDKSGKPRLSLALDADDSPRLILYDAEGAVGVELSLTAAGGSQLQLSRGAANLLASIDALGTATCRLASGDARQQMIVEPSGAAEWRLTGKQTDPEAVLRLDPVGSVSWEFLQTGRSGKLSAALDRSGQAAVQLIGDRKTFAQLYLSATGEVEVGVGGGQHGVEALMRTDQVGAAEVALSSPEHQGGPRMSMLPSGEMGVRILGMQGKSGPVMQMFKDGSAEITIVDTASQRGPVMYRGKDGVSLVGIRGENGKHGPRLYQGPKLDSLIAIPGLSGSQAGFFADPSSPAFLAVTGTDGKPVHLVPPNAAVKPEPKKDAP